MLTRNIIFFLLLIFINIFAYGQAQAQPNKVDSIVQQNSVHLLELVDKWHINPHSHIHQYFSNPFTTTDSIKKFALSNFLSCSPYLSKISSTTNAFIIQDEIVFKLCISIIANYPKNYIGQQAFENLCKYARYDHLMKYSDEIKCALANKSKIGDYRVEELLAYVKLDSLEKKKMLEQKYLSTHIRARLGDTVAGNDLIKAYNNEKIYYNRKDLIYKLGVAGTPKCLNALIKNFNDTIFDNEGNCGKISMTNYVIPKFGRLHPDNQLLTSDFENLTKYPRKKPTNEEVTTYLHKVIDWMKQTYGVSPDISEPLPFIVVDGICKN